MSSHHKKLTVCPNCSTPLKPEDNFCPNCGQENHDLKVPFSHLFLELFESVFHFETKFFNTIKIIFTRPGRITRDFWEGKRARYMHPFRLYVFVSFLFFLIANKVADQAIGEFGKENQKSGVLKPVEGESEAAELGRLVNTENWKAGDSVLTARGLRKFRNLELSLPKDKQRRRLYLRQLRQWNDQQLDALLKSEKMDPTPDNRANLRQALSLVPETANIPTVLSLGSINVNFTTIEERDVFTNKIRNYSDTQIDSLLIAYKSEPSWLNRTLMKQLAKARNNSEDFWHDLSHAFMKNLSLVMFILMPFVAFLMLMMYYRRKRYYFEHLIFSIHAHTVVFILFAIFLAIDYFLHANLEADWIFLVGWIYFLLSLKTVYQQSWPKTVFKFLLLSVSYAVIAGLFFMGALVWGFMTL